METARADRSAASKEFGGDEAAAASRKAKVGEFFSAEATRGQSIAANAAIVGVNAIDKLAMGDKNFGAQSEAIDGAVHAASGALMQSGNPYLMAAGAALEGANFLTKAGGQTVQGFDVDITSSGYGNLGHMESSSSRDFGAMIGLGGIFGQGKLKAKLARRNEKLKQALVAADIAEEQSFQQEARANSIENVIENKSPVLLKKTVSEETSRQIRTYMKQTMTTGTGKRAQIEGYSIGAKTGTAEKLPRGNGEYLLSFMGFAPADNPEVLIYVVVDEPNVDDQSLGIYVVELSKKIMEEVFPYLNVTKTE